MPSACLPFELLPRVRADVHFACESLPRFPKRQRQILHASLPDDHEVDIARRKLSSPRHGAIDEGDRDLRGERGERFADHVNKSRGLGHEALKLGQEWALGVSLVVDLLPFRSLAEDACLDKIHELSLKACLGDLEDAGKFAGVPPALRLEEDCGEDPLPDDRKEGVNPATCTHSAYL